MGMDRLFSLMKEKGASDMFLTINSPIHLKIQGSLIPINQQKMDMQQLRALLSEVLSAADMARLEQENELNIGIPVRDVGRFRLPAFRQRGTFSAVFRFIPHTIPALGTLGLPSILSELIMDKRGLILLVGATGSGKSTTIASMLDYRNELRTGHILTLEDPIEFLFNNKRSIVNQREIGTDSASLEIALKNSLRQAPDCIMIGEIRDKETMSAALAYAQSGHLVLTTLHANNSYNALNRIISFYPIENRPALLLDIASTLRAIISQRLVRSAAGARLAASEVMLNTHYVAELIEKGEITQIKEAIEKSLSPGSQTFEQTLLQMIKSGAISQEEGLANADSPTNLLWQLNNNEQSSKLTPQESPPSAPSTPNEPSFSEFTFNT
ncbi:MAG: PilT/PilU family type 4a pilus ATPase [Oxalobacteraceae bacterium]